MFPFVLTAARLTEHHTAGGMSRTLPYLSELQPDLFVEVSPELARERGLAHLGWAHVVTSRAAVEARVMVTDRMAPLRVQDRVVHQVWMPYHWGPAAWSPATSSTTCSASSLDPNVLHPGEQGRHLRRPARPAAARRRAARVARATTAPRAGITSGHRRRQAATAARTSQHVAAGHDGHGGQLMTIEQQPVRPAADDVAGEAGHTDHPPRVGFFTDTSVCIGCKACEVACKEWNDVPEDGLDLLGMSFDNTGALGANSWRHVAFIEQERPLGGPGRRGWPVFRPGRRRPA